ncbi:MAG TPA: cupin domain-containing protein [Thermoplasmata archaeon]|nr:cupin domain-containing protein [Thermoplasmata archaeon]
MPFPETVRRLPRSSLAGADVFVHDAGSTQVLFIEVPATHAAVIVPTHTHDAEWGIVVEGEIVMTFPDRTEIHSAGMTHWIPAQLPHSFRFVPGTSSIHYFVERRVRVP